MAWLHLCMLACYWLFAACCFIGWWSVLTSCTYVINVYRYSLCVDVCCTIWNIYATTTVLDNSCKKNSWVLKIVKNCVIYFTSWYGSLIKFHLMISNSFVLCLGSDISLEFWVIKNQILSTFGPKKSMFSSMNLDKGMPSSFATIRSNKLCASSFGPSAGSSFKVILAH